MGKRIKIHQRLLLGLALAGDYLEDLVGGGSRAYHAGKLWFWTPPGYQRKTYQETVWRMLRTQQIEKAVINGKPVLKLTNTGKKHLQRNFNLLNWQSKKWDKQWRLVIFDLPVKKNYLRNRLREKLKTLGFGCWQKSIYISPYDLTADMVEFLKEKKLLGYAWALTAKHEYLTNPQKLANQVWRLEKLNGQYQQLYQKLKKAKKVKRALYDAYLDLLLKDPLLPKELLPQPWWETKIRSLLT